MTGPVDDELEAPPPEPRDPGRAHAGSRLSRAVCPYLEVPGERWRHAAPSREHRCLAVFPAPPLTADKQRRLCLEPAHVTCSSYLAALDVRRAWAGSGEVVEPGDLREGASAPQVVGANRWAISRTAPVVAGAGGGVRVLDLFRHRAAAQIALVGLLVVAFVAVAVSRPPSEGSSGALLAGTPSPLVTPSPTAAVTARPSPSPAPTVVVTPAPTPSPTPTPAPPTPTVYRVVSGDTLSGIAARFGTTVKAIMDLNSLTSTVLRIGQQLLIPPAAGGTPTALPSAP